MSTFDKDKILELLDIVELIGEQVRLKRQGKDFIGLCPFHNDHKPSFSVSPQKQIFKCWSCGVGGDAIKFVMLRQKVEFPEALAILAQRVGLEADHETRDPAAGQRREAMRAALTWAKSFYQRNLRESPAGAAALTYALGRGLNEATIEQFGLGFAPAGWNELEHAAVAVRISGDVLLDAALIKRGEQGRTYDVFRNRLVFPINDSLGRTVAFGGRALGSDPPKYLNSPETPLFSKSRILFGFDHARRSIEARKAAIVVEGYMDAVLLHQHGFTNVVAPLGTALTPAHVKLLRPICREVILCFDGDAAGVRAADRGVSVALTSDLAVKVVVLEGVKDPADCVVEGGAAAFERALEGAIDALDFKWRQSRAAYSGGSLEAQRAAIQDYIAFIASATREHGIDPLAQGLIAGRLADLLGLTPDNVTEMLVAQRRRGPRFLKAHNDSNEASDSDGHNTAEYPRSIAGFSPGLVGAVEELLGLLIRDSNCWRQVTDDLATACGFSWTWDTLYQVCLAVHEDLGQYSTGEVVERCDQPPILDLIQRCLARVRAVAECSDLFAAASQRLEAELRLRRRAELHSELAGPPEDGAAAFEKLRTLARGEQAVLPAERLRNIIAR